jgi:rRNA-processing protein EBP2
MAKPTVRKRETVPPIRAESDGVESSDEELNIALQDPKLKERILHQLRAEPEEVEEQEEDDDDDDSHEYEAQGALDEEFIYEADAMAEIRGDISWGGETEQWKEGLVLTSKHEIEVEDVENDLDRELAFYNQALQAAFFAVTKFEDEGVKWRRPDDYLAEMVKSDGHMAKVKEQLVHEQTVIEEAEQRRKDRESRKYSKQVAAERRKERSQQKKQAIESVTTLRKQRAKNNFEGDIDLDQVGLGDAKFKGKRLGDRFSAGSKSNKRQKRDAKYGFGGPKRRQKMNDAYSSAATDGPRRVNGGVKKRPGKARRAAQRHR